MVEGFSPHQLVFGRNPCLPGVLDDELPALEGTSSSEVIAKQLNTCHTARKAFAESEKSEKVRRALRAKVRVTRKEFHTGEKVLFQKPDTKQWKGPAKVIGLDGKTILLKHGSHMVRCHESHVQEMPYDFVRDTNDGRNDLLRY